MHKSLKSVTLVELIISMVIISMMVLSFYSLDTFSRQQAISADRRSKVQNSLAYALEHMSKYVQQATGDITGDINNNNQGIQQIPSGFKVRVSGGGWIQYQLNSHTLTASCSGIGCPAGFQEDLSTKVLNLNALIGDGGSSINIVLVGCYNPTQVPIPATRLTNPQVTMETKIICNACSSN